MKKSFLLIIICMVFLLCAGCGKSEVVVEHSSSDTTGDEQREDSAEHEELDSGQVSTTEASTQSRSKQYAVYVCGAVKTPGVYYLAADCIKQDALNTAGGFSEGAAEWYVNLAEPVKDGEMLYFPFENEFDSGVSPMGYEDADSNPEKSDSGKDGSGLVNINTADKEELMTLSGVGESRAEAIIKYREEHGRFNDISDICNVSGIKEGLYNKIKDFITVG